MSFSISSHLDRLPYRATAPQAAAQRPAAAKAPWVETPAVAASASHGASSSLGAILGRLGVESRDAPAPAPAEPATPAVRPNLDALNRVLSHYAAQSAGVDTIISLVRS